MDISKGWSRRTVPKRNCHTIVLRHKSYNINRILHSVPISWPIGNWKRDGWVNRWMHGLNHTITHWHYSSIKFKFLINCHCTTVIASLKHPCVFAIPQGRALLGHVVLTEPCSLRMCTYAQHTHATMRVEGCWSGEDPEAKNGLKVLAIFFSGWEWKRHSYI